MSFTKKLFLTLMLVAIVVIAQFSFTKFKTTARSPSNVGLSEKMDEEENDISGVFGPLRAPKKYNPTKIEIGRLLFNDQRLSKNNTVSCASCHNLMHGGADNRQFAIGIDGSIGHANTPTVFNSALNFRQFWDGRAETLSEQTESPIHNPKEMGSNWPEIIGKLNKDSKLKQLFSKVYSDGINQKNIVDSIVEFEKTLITLDAPFDKYLKGDTAALTELQISGYKKFSSYGCVACHQGQNIGGNMFQTMGIAGDYFKERGGFYPSDLGRYNITKNEMDKHTFRVPSLRNVELTAPYFHDGAVKTLEEAVKKMARFQLGRSLSKEDTDAIVAFLKSLTGKAPDTIKENTSKGAASGENSK